MTRRRPVWGAGGRPYWLRNARAMPLDDPPQPIEVERLLQDPIYSAGRLFGHGGGDDDRVAPEERVAAHRREELPAGHAGHHQIPQHQTMRVAGVPEPRKRLLTVACFADRESLLLQGGPHESPEIFVVFHDENRLVGHPVQNLGTGTCETVQSSVDSLSAGRANSPEDPVTLDFLGPLGV